MTDLRQAAHQALEALEFDGFTPEDATHCHYTTRAITALREALAQSEQEQENPSLIEWKEQGEEIMAQAGIGFHLGAWWADRPWRQR